MSYDYDEPEEEDIAPEPAPNSTPAGTFTATVSREEIVSIVADRFHAKMSGYYGEVSDMRKAVQAVLSRQVREQAQEHIEQLTREAVATTVQTLIADGWEKTDSNGRTCGRVTIKDIVVGYLTKTDSYDRESLGHKLAKELFQAAVKQHLEPLIKEAQEKVRAMMNTRVDEALRKAVLDGLGLRS